MEAPLDEFEFAFEEEEEEAEVGEGQAAVASGVHRAHRATAEQKAEAKEQRRRARFVASRTRHRQKLKERNVKRDFTWVGVPLEEIAFNKPVVCVDLGFAPRMRPKEVVSVVNQIQMVYGLNRKSKRPLELHFVGTGDPHIAPLFLKHSGYPNWKLFKQEKVDEFPGSPQDCVYLSPESPNLLDEIDESKVYIIGGISDNQNDMKGATLLKAAQLGFNHARLPLKEHAPWLTTRGTILNINHCYNILLLKAAGMSWAEAIDISVPTRESFRGESN